MPFLRCLMVLLLGLATFGAGAQTHRCVVDGRVYFSQRPCPNPSGTVLGAYGPVPSRSTPTYSSPRPHRQADEHVKYLGAECASLNEAIRTAPSRGVGHQVVRDLNDEYKRKCQEEDQYARQKWSEEMKLQRDERRTALAAADQDRARAQREAEHCNGMRDVIQLRRQRIDSLKPAEVESLRDFEQRYNARCLQK